MNLKKIKLLNKYIQYMKVLWLVSFRPIGKSKSNDLFQSMFVDSVKIT